MLKVMNSKEVKHLREQLREQYGFTEKLDVVFLLNEKQEKISVTTRDLAMIDLKGLRVDTMGCYFAAWYKGQLRLTIEGAQLIGPKCPKNVVAVTKREMQRWLSGENLAVADLAEAPAAEQGAFVILRHGDDFLGCGKLTEKEILNYIPKTRYVHALYED